MSLVSWTLAGPGTAPIIGDALRSVAPIVDACLVVWTGAVPPSAVPYDLSTIYSACLAAVPGGSNSVRWVEWAWRDDYGAARNAALDFAKEALPQPCEVCGAHGGHIAWCGAGWDWQDIGKYEMTAAEHGLMSAPWSCMVDTDERIVCPDPTAFRSWLSSLPASVQVVLVHHNDGSHTRERFFRMPARYRFIGRTHEMLPCPENEQAIAPRELIRWDELPKTRETLRGKFARDVEMLRQDIIANPRNGAACYYLGTSLQSLAVYAREENTETHSLACPASFDSVPCDCGEALARRLFGEAIEAFREHRAIDTSSGRAWHEGTAFSCYRAAECYLALGNPNRALDCAAAGLVLDAGIGELYWIAAVASLQEGRTEQARAWAMSAKAHGMGSASEKRRRGFRVVRGLTTGPDEVLSAIDHMSVGFVPIRVDGSDPEAPMVYHDERGSA